MSSSKEYLEFILEQLSELDEITYRARLIMMQFQRVLFRYCHQKTSLGDNVPAT